jgi:hypothetical protein
MTRAIRPQAVTTGKSDKVNLTPTTDTVSMCGDLPSQGPPCAPPDKRHKTSRNM